MIEQTLLEMAEALKKAAAEVEALRIDVSLYQERNANQAKELSAMRTAMRELKSQLDGIATENLRLSAENKNLRGEAKSISLVVGYDPRNGLATVTPFNMVHR